MAKTIIEEMDELKAEIHDCNKGKKTFVSEQDVFEAYKEYQESMSDFME